MQQKSNHWSEKNLIVSPIIHWISDIAFNSYKLRILRMILTRIQGIFGLNFFRPNDLDFAASEFEIFFWQCTALES